MPFTDSNHSPRQSIEGLSPVDLVRRRRTLRAAAHEIAEKFAEGPLPERFHLAIEELREVERKLRSSKSLIPGQQPPPAGAIVQLILDEGEHFGFWENDAYWMFESGVGANGGLGLKPCRAKDIEAWQVAPALSKGRWNSTLEPPSKELDSYWVTLIDGSQTWATYQGNGSWAALSSDSEGMRRPMDVIAYRVRK